VAPGMGVPKSRYTGHTHCPSALHTLSGSVHSPHEAPHTGSGPHTRSPQSMSQQVPVVSSQTWVSGRQSPHEPSQAAIGFGPHTRAPQVKSHMVPAVVQPLPGSGSPQDPPQLVGSGPHTRSPQSTVQQVPSSWQMSLSGSGQAPQSRPHLGSGPHTRLPQAICVGQSQPFQVALALQVMVLV
jgi:hypothetical protein